MVAGVEDAAAIGAFGLQAAFAVGDIDENEASRHAGKFAESLLVDCGGQMFEHFHGDDAIHGLVGQGKAVRGAHEDWGGAPGGADRSAGTFKPQGSGVGASGFEIRQEEARPGAHVQQAVHLMRDQVHGSSPASDVERAATDALNAARLEVLLLGRGFSGRGGQAKAAERTDFFGPLTGKRLHGRGGMGQKMRNATDNGVEKPPAPRKEHPCLDAIGRTPGEHAKFEQLAACGTAKVAQQGLVEAVFHGGSLHETKIPSRQAPSSPECGYMRRDRSGSPIHRHLHDLSVFVAEEQVAVLAAVEEEVAGDFYVARAVLGDQVQAAFLPPLQ